MTTIEAAAGRDDPHHLGHDWESPYIQHTLGHAERGLASKRIITAFGFWIFLVSDIIMFSAFFATYAVLVGNTAGGPSGRELFNLRNVGLETAFLLVSSFTCGLASIGARAHSGSWFYGAMAATFILGAGVSEHRGPGVRKHGRARGRPDAERVPLGLLYAGRMPRPSYHRRPALAADDDGAGVRQGVPAGHLTAHALLQPVLARPGHHLGCDIHRGVFDGAGAMSYSDLPNDLHPTDIAPGVQRLDGAEIAEGIRNYLIGLALATLLTIVSFYISGTTLVWGPSIPVALVVLAIAQMGVHLVFFLHITTGPDSVNNVMALAFGVLIVLLILGGSLWIMANMNYNLAPMNQMMQMQLEAGPGMRAVTARGVIAPTAPTPVGARVSGVIQALHCDANMQVKAGQVCAKIDPRPYQIVVDQRRADLAPAEARLEKDKADLAQAKAAFESHEAVAKRPAISRAKRLPSRARPLRGRRRRQSATRQGSQNSKRRFMPPRPTSAIPISFRRLTEQWSHATSKWARRSRWAQKRRRSSSSPQISPSLTSTPLSARKTAARSSSVTKLRSPSRLFRTVRFLAR